MIGALGFGNLELTHNSCKQESSRILQEGNFTKYLALSPQERTQKIIEIQELIDDIHAVPREQVDLFFELGNLFAAEADYQSAIASFDQALHLKPDYHQAWYDRGVALGYLDQRKDEITSYDEALKIKPDKEKAWNNRGSALFHLGRYQEALQSYDKALGIRPDHVIWTNRGVVLFDLERYEEAITSFDKALDFKPDYDAAWSNRGDALGKLGQFDEAITSYDKALEFNPGNYEAQYNREILLGIQDALKMRSRAMTKLSNFSRIKIKPGTTEALLWGI